MNKSEIKSVFGIPVDDVLMVRKKLTVLGIEMKDVIEFLDRDKIQLFAEMKNKINNLERRIQNIKKEVYEA